MPLFAPRSVLIYSQKGVCKMTVYEEILSLLSHSPELYDFLPAHPKKLCMPCKHNYISARGSHGKGSAFETTTTTEFNAYIRAETGILGSAHSNTDIIFRFPQHNTVSFAAVLRQGLQRRVAGRMPVYGEALRKVPRKSGFRKGHSGCRSIFGLFTTIISGYGGR